MSGACNRRSDPHRYSERRYRFSASTLAQSAISVDTKRVFGR
jgi:hypothetical protein